MAEATVLATIRQEIDKAVKKRERYKNLVNGKKEILNSLKEKINDCIRKVSATSFENKSLYIDKLRATVEKIDKILEDAAPLINRFNRDTINLGVAGATQAGKSTFLETLSGVKLPRAKEEDKVHGGDSTTAAKSNIINSNETKVTVHFRTKDEFVKNVQAYLPEKDKAKVSDIVDFERLPLDEIMLATTDANERTEISRLIEAQQAFVYNKKMLGESPKEISVQDIPDYVTYYQGKDNQHRFWSVVKLVEIRCPFVALGNNDIKLTLVDLPGMGESPRVDKQMVDELENEVDTVLLFFKSNAVTQEADNKAFDKIKDAQKFIMDKTKFLSFLINVRTDDTNPEGHICTIQNRINNIFQHSANEKYKVYITKVFETDKVHQDVVDVLTKLVGDIEDLDSDTIDGWLKSINFDEIIDLINAAYADFSKSIPCTESEYALLNNKANNITQRIEVNFAKLQDSYNYKIVNENGEMATAKDNYNKVKSRIKEKVFEINKFISEHPLGLDKDEELSAWTKEALDSTSGTRQATFQENEINRLRTYIRRKYNEIQFVATGLYDELIDEIIENFNLSLEAAEPFIKQKGRNGVNELLSSLRSTLEGYDNSFIKIAFESLTDEKVSLHQIAFKYIFDTNYALIMSTKKQKGGRSQEYFSSIEEGATDEEVAKSIKNGLITMVRDVNGKIAEAIGNNCTEPIMSFLYSKIEYFVDSLVRTQLNIDLVNNYVNFVSPVRMQLWPDTFGSSNEAKVAREISNELREIINNINNI